MATPTAANSTSSTVGQKACKQDERRDHEADDAVEHRVAVAFHVRGMACFMLANTPRFSSFVCEAALAITSEGVLAERAVEFC